MKHAELAFNAQRFLDKVCGPPRLSLSTQVCQCLIIYKWYHLASIRSTPHHLAATAKLLRDHLASKYGHNHIHSASQKALTGCLRLAMM